MATTALLATEERRGENSRREKKNTEEQGVPARGVWVGSFMSCVGESFPAFSWGGGREKVNQAICPAAGGCALPLPWAGSLWLVSGAAVWSME